MFRQMTLLATAAIAMTVATAAYGDTLKVASGSPTGTYSQMLKEINGACSEQIPIVEQNTGGSMENMRLLTGNQVNAALVQTDVLYFRARTENLDNVKTL